MRQEGVSTVRERGRRTRALVDFGVDESWERAAPRRVSGASPLALDARASEGVLNGAAHAPSAMRAVAPHDAPTLSETSTSWSHASAVSTPAPRPGAGVPGRRTVTIRGRGAERDLAFPAHRSTRRPSTRPHERPGFKPDRAAMWAILLGVFLVLVAATSSHAATLQAGATAHHLAVPHAAAHHAPAARPAALVVRISTHR